ncbi:MAG: hypothetical protein JJE05_04005 [Actinobacteria bacterium]|nr:hypothetical protein [Actinomycetota bacterium]
MRRRGQRGILFEHEGHGIPGIEMNHDYRGIPSRSISWGTASAGGPR